MGQQLDAVTISPPPIRPLTGELIDQIAAGEVVERPAHLVKELIENALDAGATRIEVSVDDGGRKVVVRDNGRGIPPDQLELAVSRFATSKIASSEDLWQLHSFGFRGEALASIASVSEFSLCSRTASAASAHVMKVSFGKISSDPQWAAGNVGTTVVVDRLFENVPARMKFLRSATSEIMQIRNVFRACALSAPNSEFILEVGGRRDLRLPLSENLVARAEQILECPLFVAEGNDGASSVRVAFAAPTVTQKTSRGIWTFCQKRWIQDRSLQQAAIEAYRGLLMHGEFPVAVIDLELPPEQVDVNIHPAKSQVKYADPQYVFRLVCRSLRGEIERAPWRATSSSSDEQTAELAHRNVEFAVRQYSMRDFVREPSRTFAHSAAPASKVTTTPALSSAIAQPAAWSDASIVGQVMNVYIVAQATGRLILVDQHAAHERVIYERLRRRWSGGELQLQPLLAPEPIALDEARVELLISQRNELLRLGLTLDALSPSSVQLIEIPAMISLPVARQAVIQFANELQESGGGGSVERAIHDVMASMACHGAIRAGRRLQEVEMRRLLDDMDEFPLSGFCPHGRPVFIEWTEAQLEREFGRRN